MVWKLITTHCLRDIGKHQKCNDFEKIHYFEKYQKPYYFEICQIRVFWWDEMKRTTGETTNALAKAISLLPVLCLQTCYNTLVKRVPTTPFRWARIAGLTYMKPGYQIAQRTQVAICLFWHPRRNTPAAWRLPLSFSFRRHRRRSAAPGSLPRNSCFDPQQNWIFIFRNNDFLTFFHNFGIFSIISNNVLRWGIPTIPHLLSSGRELEASETMRTVERVATAVSGVFSRWENTPGALGQVPKTLHYFRQCSEICNGRLEKVPFFTFLQIWGTKLDGWIL